MSCNKFSVLIRLRCRVYVGVRSETFVIFFVEFAEEGSDLFTLEVIHGGFFVGVLLTPVTKCFSVLMILLFFLSLHMSFALSYCPHSDLAHLDNYSAKILIFILPFPHVTRTLPNLNQTTVEKTNFRTKHTERAETREAHGSWNCTQWCPSQPFCRTACARLPAHGT